MQKVKDFTQNEKKRFENHVSDKGFLSRIYTKTQNSTIERQLSFEMSTKDLNRHFSKKKKKPCKWPVSTRCSTLVTREI